MSTQTFPTTAAPSHFFARLGAFLTGFARALSLASQAQARFDQIQRLQSLSDEELARRGIARDNIIKHVYADLMGPA